MFAGRNDALTKESELIPELHAFGILKVACEIPPLGFEAWVIPMVPGKVIFPARQSQLPLPRVKTQHPNHPNTKDPKPHSGNVTRSAGKINAGDFRAW
jgi:hypothetical protein